MFVAKGVQRKNGKVYIFYSLRKAVWDKQAKRQKQVYVAGLGPSRTISLEKAEKIAQKIGCSLDDLKRAGVRIAPAKRDDEKPKQRSGESPPSGPPQRITESFPFRDQIKLSRGWIRPRSEGVMLDGQPLTRGTHYSINYKTGEIWVISPRTGRTITVEYETIGSGPPSLV